MMEGLALLAGRGNGVGTLKRGRVGGVEATPIPTIRTRRRRRPVGVALLNPPYAY